MTPSCERVKITDGKIPRLAAFILCIRWRNISISLKTPDYNRRSSNYNGFLRPVCGVGISN